MSAIILGEPGDYPSALWVGADQTNFSKSRRHGAWSQIVIHETDGHSAARPTAEMWREPHHGSSAHFVIGQFGEVIQSVRLIDTAWHAHTANSYSVGIEHCARAPGEFGPNDAGLPPSMMQLASAAKLVAWLCRQLGRRPSRDFIRGHAEADPATTHTQCPTGCGLDLDRYVLDALVAYGDRRV